METATEVISTSEVLAEIERLLGAVDHSARGLATDAERLELLQTTVRGRPGHCARPATRR